MEALTPIRAMRIFKSFLLNECEGRETRTAWMRINGSRLCSRCGQDRKKKKLYVYCDPDSFVYLHCFRASCDVNRIITMQDFQALGFTNQEVISVLMNSANKTNVRVYDAGSGKPMVVEDLVPSKEQCDYYRKRIGRELTPREISEIRFIPNLYRVFLDNLDQDDILWETIFKARLTDSKEWFCIANDTWDVFTIRHITKNIKCILSTREGTNHGISYVRGGTESDEPTTLVVAEGVFDILNIFYRFAYMPNAIYVASIGQDAMLHMIQYYKQKYCDTLKQLIVFADSDIYDAERHSYTYRKSSIEWLARQVFQKLGKDAFEEVHVCYNRASKDFGDMGEPIYAMREDWNVEDLIKKPGGNTWKR